MSDMPGKTLLDLDEAEVEARMLPPFRDALKRLIDEAAPNLFRDVAEPILDKCFQDAETLAKVMVSDLTADIDPGGLKIIVSIRGWISDGMQCEVPVEPLRDLILRGCGGYSQPDGGFSPALEHIDEFIRQLQLLIDDLKQIPTHPPRA